VGEGSEVVKGLEGVSEPQILFSVLSVPSAEKHQDVLTRYHAEVFSPLCKGGIGRKKGLGRFRVETKECQLSHLLYFFSPTTVPYSRYIALGNAKRCQSRNLML
jgi:hypothetical protein